MAISAVQDELGVLLAFVLTLWGLASRQQESSMGPWTRKIQDLDYLTELIEAGEIKAVIDRRYAPEQIAEPHSYVE